MTLKDIQRLAIEPALLLLPARMTSATAELLMLAIGLQESRFEHRRQIGGPARGFWQFEQGGGVRGVLEHAKAGPIARSFCAALGVPATASAVYAALERNDVLAAGFARLFLFTNPNELPAMGECAAAWNYYLATWRPGKPHRKTWDALYAQALEGLAL